MYKENLKEYGIECEARNKSNIFRHEGELEGNGFRQLVRRFSMTFLEILLIYSRKPLKSIFTDFRCYRFGVSWMEMPGMQSLETANPWRKTIAKISDSTIHQNQKIEDVEKLGAFPP
jgi:hypothetical protein